MKQLQLYLQKKKIWWNAEIKKRRLLNLSTEANQLSSEIYYATLDSFYTSFTHAQIYQSKKGT